LIYIDGVKIRRSVSVETMKATANIDHLDGLELRSGVDMQLLL